ncbi:hypothetical protein ABZ371_13125 [Streptomyces sp. NPDC005899]|uniref:hypothetical protein n=1 Tax=Streptomyces sp. NPDC005899 TaxID=3155716 RepID=UPI0033DB15F2
MRRPAVGSRGRVIAVAAGVATVVVAVCAVSGFPVTGESEEERFRSSSGRAEFCETAAPLDLTRTGELTPHKRHHVIEDLERTAPEGISADFGRLLRWYDHPEPEDEEAARASSYGVGEFIERVCDINIGGIRS